MTGTGIDGQLSQRLMNFTLFSLYFFRVFSASKEHILMTFQLTEWLSCPRMAMWVKSQIIKKEEEDEPEKWRNKSIRD